MEIKMLTVIFGSNQFIETNGIVTFVDSAKNLRKELFKIELRDDLQPMITVDIRNSNYHLLGKAYRSTSFVAVDPDYEDITQRQGSDIKSMVLLKKDTKQIVFELYNRGSVTISQNNKEVVNTIVEINGVFYMEGYPFKIEATRNYLDINTNRLSNNTKVLGGFGIELTPNGFAL
jgi:hypothetical protein